MKMEMMNVEVGNQREVEFYGFVEKKPKWISESVG